jgi:hypothetical protein
VEYRWQQWGEERGGALVARSAQKPHKEVGEKSLTQWARRDSVPSGRFSGRRRATPGEDTEAATPPQVTRDLLVRRVGLSVSLRLAPRKVTDVRRSVSGPMILLTTLRYGPVRPHCEDRAASS